MLFQLPRTCRVFTAMQPANQWGWQDYFLNKVVYLLELQIWQQSYDPKKKAEHKAKKPKPFTPDFIKQNSEPSEINKGVEVHTTDDIRDILAKPRV